MNVSEFLEGNSVCLNSVRCTTAILLNRWRQVLSTNQELLPARNTVHAHAQDIELTRFFFFVLTVLIVTDELKEMIVSKFEIFINVYYYNTNICINTGVLISP